MHTDSMESVESAHGAESAILEELMRVTELDASDLRERVGKRVAKLTAEQYRSGLEALVAARKIHGRVAMDKAGKPKKTVESYAFGEPPPPPPPPRSLAPQAVLEVLAAGPLDAASLKRRVKEKVLGLTPKDYDSVLAELVVLRELHARYKRAKDGSLTAVESYVLGPPPPPPPAPSARAPEEVLKLLQSGPVAAATLRQRVLERIPGLSAKDYTAVLARLIAASELHGRYKRAKDGTPTKVVESYALGARAADDFIAPVLGKWKEMLAAGVDAGFKKEDLVAALLTGLLQAGINVPHPGAVEPVSDDGALVLRGVRDLATREGKGALIPIRQLRGAVNLAKARFDAAVLALRAADSLVLHAHDAIANLGAVERDELVGDQHGNFYVGVALRSDQP